LQGAAALLLLSTVPDRNFLKPVKLDISMQLNELAVTVMQREGPFTVGSAGLV